MAEYARARLGLDVRTAAVEALDGVAGPVRLVAMIQVVAHFADPRRALATAAGLLDPGGFLLVETWDRDHWIARLLGRHWHEYSPPSVLHWFSRASLRRLAEETGFQFVAAGRPRKRIAVEHAVSLLRHKYRNPLLRGMVGVAERSIPRKLTLPYPTGDLFWMLLRKAEEDESHAGRG